MAKVIPAESRRILETIRRKWWLCSHDRAFLIESLQSAWDHLDGIKVGVNDARDVYRKEAPARG